MLTYQAKNCIFLANNGKLPCHCSYLCIIMLVLKHTKQRRLECTFPKLTEANQQYILGLAEGLKHAQNKPREFPDKKSPMQQDRK
jgi:hypothetical protein